MSKTIVFFGNEKLATGVSTSRPALKALQSAGYDVMLVEAKQAGKDELAGSGAEIAVLAAYGKILPQDWLDLFPKGIVNIHPSLLPLYRGSSPIESAILDGAAETGVSLMKLVPEMDAGPVYAQQKVSLTGKESKQELANNLSGIGAQLLAESLPSILDGSLEPLPQDGQPTYTKIIDKAAGHLDWTKPAVQLEREVRAYSGWPRNQAKLADIDIIVTGAHAGEGSGRPGEVFVQNKQLGVYTPEGILFIDSLIPAGKKEMPAEAFLAGYKIQ